MSELAPEVWDEVTGQYEAGVAIAAIAQAFKVSRVRIKRKADELVWVRSRRAEGDTGQQAGYSGSSQQAGNAAVISAADRRRLLIERQRAVWDDISAVREDAYRLLRGEEPRIIKGLATGDVDERLSRAAKLLTMADKDANSLRRAQEAQRQAYGIDPKLEAESKEKAEAFERRVEWARSVLKKMEDWARSKGQQVVCRCQQEGCKGLIDPVSQTAPGSG